MSVSDSAPEAQFVDRAVRRFRETLAALVEAHRRAGNVIEEVLGAPEDLGARAAVATVPEPSPWDELIGPFVRTEGAQARLGGITRQAIAAKAARRRLLRVVTSDEVHLFPVWQFKESGGVVDGLPEVLSVFKGASIDDWTLAGWFRSVDPDLAETPYEAIMRGDVDRVLAAARAARHSLAA